MGAFRLVEKYFFTIRYLKIIQIRFRLYYLIRSCFKSPNYSDYSEEVILRDADLLFKNAVSPNVSYCENKFSFLNLTKEFKDVIDWNYNEFGRLWTYNLSYFDYLNQKLINKEIGVRLIESFVSHMEFIKDGMEPYPISLRGVNWIKFLTKHRIHNNIIDNSLFYQYQVLMDNIEYHLLGNHLLENGFSLLFGAYYYHNEIFYNKAKEILENELKEQILEDGGHFELSPMYHQLILFRILDCINLVNNNSYKNQELLLLLEEKAKVMLGWINTITFKNGDIPLFNDCCKSIAPTTKQLNEYASLLGSKFEIRGSKLSESGYRKIEKGKYEIIVDVGNIGPDYIPGHAHADTFNFELYLNQKPFIVDTGISTYEKNAIRQIERSTESHNTVTINDKNQSQVWGGFRVAERAKIIDLKEWDNYIVVSHSGYKNIGAVHQRSFKMKEIEIEIKDSLIGKNVKGKAYFHLHPSVQNIDIDKNQVIFHDLDCQINFLGKDIKIDRRTYEYSLGFNKTQEGTVIQVIFVDELASNILIC